MGKKYHPKEGIHFRILKCAEEAGSTGIQIVNIIEKLELSEDDKSILTDASGSRYHNKVIKLKSTNSDYYVLTFEGKRRLVEYETLKQARSSSNKAMAVAIVAIMISITMLVFNRVDSNLLTTINDKIDRIIKAILLIAASFL